MFDYQPLHGHEHFNFRTWLQLKNLQGIVLHNMKVMWQTKPQDKNIN